MKPEKPWDGVGDTVSIYVVISVSKFKVFGPTNFVDLFLH